MSIYGHLLESVKFEFKDGKYPYYKSNIKIKGIPVIIDDDDYKDIDEIIFQKACNAINKNFNKCLDQASKDMFNHASKIDEIKDRFKSPEDLKKSLKLIDSIIYVPYKNKECIADFHMNFDTNPYLDKYHVYTLYATVMKDYSVSCSDYSYDG